MKPAVRFSGQSGASAPRPAPLDRAPSEATLDEALEDTFPASDPLSSMRTDVALDGRRKARV